MSPDIHLLWPLEKGAVDILHEYFLPYHAFSQFIKALQTLVPQHGVNLLNVTIRQVLQDNETLLNFATADSFAFVLLFSVKDETGASEAMTRFTQELVDHVQKAGGSFYLPYQTNWRLDQLKKSYQKIGLFLNIKKKYDANNMFSSLFLKKLQQGASVK